MKSTVSMFAGVMIGLCVVAACSQRTELGQKPEPSTRPAASSGQSGPSAGAQQQQGGVNLGQLGANLWAGFTGLVGATQTNPDQSGGVGNQSTVRVDAFPPSLAWLVGFFTFVMWRTHARVCRTNEKLVDALYRSRPETK